MSAIPGQGLKSNRSFSTLADSVAIMDFDHEYDTYSPEQEHYHKFRRPKSPIREGD